MKKNDTFGMIMAVMVVILVLGALPALVSVMNHNNDVQVGRPSDVETASYIIYKDGDYYCLKNGTTGRIDVRNENGSVVLNSITQNNSVYFHDSVIVDDDVLPKNNTHYYGDGNTGLILTDRAMVHWLEVSNVGLHNFMVNLTEDHLGSVWSFENSTGLVFDKVHYDGNYDAIGAIGSMLDKSNGWISNSTDVLISDSYFTKSSGTPFICSNVQNINVCGNSFIELLGHTTYGGYSPHTSAAVFLSDCDNAIYSDNYAYLIDDNVVGIIGSVNVLVDNNVIENCRHIAIIHESTTRDADAVVVSNNVGTGLFVGIMLGYYNTQSRFDGHVLICDNYISASTTGLAWAANYAIQSDWKGTNCTIKNNKLIAYSYALCFNQDRSGVDGVQNCIIEGNEIIGAVNNAGIAISAHVTGLSNSTLKDNVIKIGNSNAGSQLMYKGRYLKLIGNEFYTTNSTTTAITLGRYTIATGNIFACKNLIMPDVGCVVSYNILRYCAVSNTHAIDMTNNTVIS